MRLCPISDAKLSKRAHQVPLNLSLTYTDLLNGGILFQVRSSTIRIE